MFEWIFVCQTQFGLGVVRLFSCFLKWLNIFYYMFYVFLNPIKFLPGASETCNHPIWLTVKIFFAILAFDNVLGGNLCILCSVYCIHYWKFRPSIPFKYSIYLCLIATLYITHGLFGTILGVRVLIKHPITFSSFIFFNTRLVEICPTNC